MEKLKEKEHEKKLSIIFMVVTALSLNACDTESNVFEIIIDDSYIEFITMGTSADYAPYEYLTNDSNNKTQVVGIDIEIGKKIAQKLGKNLRVIHRNFDFLIDDLTENRVDFVISH